MDAAWIFDGNISFSEKALRLFRFQAADSPVYKRYLEALNCDATGIKSITKIPFLPISFFKQFSITTTGFEAQTIFESSGTTGSVNSRHYIKYLSLYEQSFRTAFEAAYGPVSNYCILGLLPSYLERGSSSLVYMVADMIKSGGHLQSGFYLYDFKKLAQTLEQLESAGQKTLLIGVTYALLDFAAAFPMPLRHAIVMETGGMKGRKKELLRPQVHALLQAAFGLPYIHSEYGMTELLSQAYAKREGMFQTPPWMKVLLREEDDPFGVHTSVTKPTTGALNIIDLANIYSCAFLATEDVARLHPDGSFEVLGRMDNSDIRGCSLMAV